MIFVVLMLLSLYAATAHGQDFVCGYNPEEGVEGASHGDPFYRRGNTDAAKLGEILVLPLFGKFKGAADPPGINLKRLKDKDNGWTENIENLLKLGHKGSLAHYFNEMSYGTLKFKTPDPAVASKWFESNQSLPSNYLTSCGADLSGWSTALRTFSLEILADADADPDINFKDYDSNGDGEVDLAIIFTPEEFSKLCKANGTALHINYTTTHSSTPSAVVVKNIITSDHKNNFPYLVGLLSHEYGHVMGLPELFDRTNVFRSSPDSIKNHSAGIGYWGTMAKGNNGYVKTSGVVDGPAPLSAWSRIKMGWITPQSVTGDTGPDRLSIPDINSSASNSVYKIGLPGRSWEYFLLSNRQNTYDGTSTSIGGYYDGRAPQSGLLIWHIDENIKPHRPRNIGGKINPYGINDVNAIEEHKRVDLECADGLFSDRGAPSANPTNNRDPVSGGDNLDYWTGNDTYRNTHNGNIGDKGDMWTGGDFAPDTNPSSAFYKGGTTNPRSRPSSLASRCETLLRTQQMDQ